jgi:hypothetical protein
VVDKVFGRRLEGPFSPRGDGNEEGSLVLSPASLPGAPCVAAPCIAGEMCCAAVLVVQGGKVLYSTAVVPVGVRKSRQKFYAVCKGH